jgi:quinol monooxygenase YgiN
MVPVVAFVKAKAGKEKELENMLKELVLATRKEKGCHAYNLHHDTNDARSFIFIESWESEAALQAHLATPHIAAAMARKDELIEILEIKTLRPVVVEA